MTERLPTNLLKPLLDLGSWLDAIQAQAIVVGGVAASFLGRPRFTQDIEGLLQAHPNLDLHSVRQWVGEFASVTAMSDLIEDFDKLLARLNRTL